MPGKLRCGSCGSEFQFEERLVGKKVRCRQCRAVLTIPGASDEPGALPPLVTLANESESEDSRPLSERVNWKRQRQREEEPEARPIGSRSGLLLLLGGLIFGAVAIAASFFLWRTVSGPSQHLVAQAAPKALDIQPTGLTKETRVALNGHVDTLRVAGGGRYLVLSLSGQESLAVFDVNEARVVRTIHHGMQLPRFAAGMNDVVVTEPPRRSLQRYDLATGELKLERKARDLIFLDSTNFELGHASAGPLVVSDALRDGTQRIAETRFFDLQTLQELPVPGALEKKLQREQHLVSPSGRFITSDLHLIELTESGLQHRAEWTKPTNFILVGAGDKVIYPSGDQPLTARGLANLVPSGRSQDLFLPATQEGYYVQIKGDEKNAVLTKESAPFV